MKLNCNQLNMLIFLHIIIVGKYRLKFSKLHIGENFHHSCKKLFHLFSYVQAVLYKSESRVSITITDSTDDARGTQPRVTERL